jgi:hypothetical protein
VEPEPEPAAPDPRRRRVRPSRRRFFGSLRFDGEVPVVAGQLQTAMDERDADLEIIDMAAGGDIDLAVQHGIKSCDTFVVFGSAKYGENTGNMACTYYESKFAWDQKKRIILIRMIPFDQEYEFEQAQFLFGLNMLVLPWMLGTPMPVDLPDRILAAIADGPQAPTSPAPQAEVAAPVTTLAEAAAAAGVAEQDLFSMARADLSEALKDLGISVLVRNKLLLEAEAKAAESLHSLCKSTDPEVVDAALQTFSGRSELKQYQALVAYSTNELASLVRVRPAFLALQAGVNRRTVANVQSLVSEGHANRVHNRSTLGKLGAMAVLAAALRDSASDAGLKCNMCGLLCTMVYQLPANTGAAVEAGCLEALVEVMRLHPEHETAQRDCLGTLVNMVPPHGGDMGVTAASRAAAAGVAELCRAASTRHANNRNVVSYSKLVLDALQSCA